MEFKTAVEYLEEIGWGRYNLNVFIQCGTAWATYMMWAAGIAYILEGSEQDFGINTVEVGLLGACFPFGLMIGSFIWGITGDKYGRLWTLKITIVLSAIFSGLLVVSIHPAMSAVSLLLLGVAQGGELAVAGTMFCEFCPPSKLSYLTRMAIFWGIGGTFVALIALIVTLTNTIGISTWRFIVGSIFVVEAVSAFFRFSLEETPTFCQNTGQIERMMKILNNVSKRNTGMEFHFDEKLKGTQEDTLGSTERPKNVSSSVLMKKLLSGSNLRLVLIFTMYGASSFSYTSMLYFMPIFLETLPVATAYSIILLQQALGIPGTIVGSWMVGTRFGRKFTIVIAFALAGLCCFLFLMEANIIAIVASTSIMNFLAIMGYSAVYTVTPESFPSDIRNLGSGFANIASRVTGVISPIFTGWLISNNGGLAIAITLFAVLFGVTAISAIPLKETRPSEKTKTLLS